MRPLLAIFTVVIVGYAALLAGMFLVHAIIVMEKASSVSAAAITKFGSPMGEIGVACAAVIAALVGLLACVRYFSRPRERRD